MATAQPADEPFSAWRVLSNEMNGGAQFEAVYDLYKADIFRFIFHLTGNRTEAEDLFQETWLRAVRHGQPFPARQDLKPWLLTIVLNLHRDALRRNRVRRLFLLRHYRREQPDSLSSAGYAPPSTEPARAAEHALLQRDIDQAVAGLPEKQRRVFLLSEFEGLRQSEIAGIMGIPVGTVKSLLYRAIKRLQRDLAGHNPKAERIKCDAKILSV
jgi:RNA polymerase sigma-70 factor (ECF subfamily)